MSDTVTLNKLIIQFNYAKIDAGFDIYEFTTSDKYIKYGAKILDEIFETVSARSIVFDGGKKFYVLYNKADNLHKDLIMALKLEKFKALSARKLFANEVHGYLLGQILLNTLNNYKSESLAFNNVTGKLFCSNFEWFKYGKTKENHKIKQIPCLEIKIDKNNVLNFPITTFTSFAEKDKLIFKKKKINDYPMYKIANNATLKRTEFSFDKDNFIQKQFPNTRNSIKLIDFASYEAFLLSKCGVLYKVVRLIEQKLSEYLSLNFVTISDYATVKCTREDEENKNNIIKSVLCNAKINLVNKAIGNGVEIFVSSVRDSFNELADCKMELAKEVCDGLNVVVINNKEYYEKYKELDDLHDLFYGTAIVQHLTLEDYSANVSAAIHCIVNELVIKKDCQNKKITFVDWPKFNCKVGLCIKNQEKFAFIEVDEIGNINFMQKENEIFATDIYQDIISKYIDFENSVGKNVECIIKINDTIIGIRKSGMFTLPKFVIIGNALAETAKKEVISKSELQLSFKSIFNTKISDKNRHELELLINNIENNNDDSFSKNKITTMSNNRSLMKLICNAIYESTGKRVKAYFRSKDVKFNLFGSNLNINWFEVNGKKFYFVGEKNEGIQSEFARASIVREVCNLSGSDVDMNLLTKLMTVDFVRDEQYTVVPFLVKYLRELINMS